MATRNSTGWKAGGPKSTGTHGLRRQGIQLIALGAFVLVAGGAASVFGNANAPMDVLTVAGLILCLVGWRLLIVARRRERNT